MKQTNRRGRPFKPAAPGRERVRTTSVQVEPSVIETCQEKHGSLPNALRFAAKAKVAKK